MVERDRLFVISHCSRLIDDAQPHLFRPLAKVDIFIKDGEESLIKELQGTSHLPPHSDCGPGHERHALRMVILAVIRLTSSGVLGCCQWIVDHAACVLDRLAVRIENLAADYAYVFI